MANKMPSMLALLGLLAVAGYQNRDKIAGMLKDVQTPNPGGQPGNTQNAGGLGGLLSGLGGLFGGAPGNSALSGGLGDLLNTFRNAGQADTADSWITPGVPTKGLTPDQVAQAVGEENLSELAQRTGLSRADLLQRLATAIPDAVDRMTPDGRMPDETQARSFFGA